MDFFTFQFKVLTKFKAWVHHTSDTKCNGTNTQIKTSKTGFDYILSLLFLIFFWNEKIIFDLKKSEFRHEISWSSGWNNWKRNLKKSWASYHLSYLVQKLVVIELDQNTWTQQMRCFRCTNINKIPDKIWLVLSSIEHRWRGTQCPKQLSISHKTQKVHWSMHRSFVDDFSFEIRTLDQLANVQIHLSPQHRRVPLIYFYPIIYLGLIWNVQTHHE